MPSLPLHSPWHWHKRQTLIQVIFTRAKLSVLNQAYLKPDMFCREANNQ